MSVDRDEVRRIADLAKLSLADDEVDRLAEEMSRILDHARRLREEEGGAEDSAGAKAPDRTSPGRSAPGGASPGPPAPDPSPLDPDPLLHPPGAMAPDLRERFFVVPPPPGVMGEDADGSQREDT